MRLFHTIAVSALALATTLSAVPAMADDAATVRRD